ncbi:MAG: helix-turn-helix domain-containing protein [Oscillospiraceae bacterium]|nr:helix-turn-helix domain-containing protein [Oscillospiraceae bacterium]
MRAYMEAYLNNAVNKFGNMMDYAVNDCELDGDQYLSMFVSSGLAQQFERGNPKVIAGMSGIDTATQAIRIVTGRPPAAKPAQLDYRTAEFWAGWALAQYQWYTAQSFSSILRVLPFNNIVALYPALHEADITKFYAVADEIYFRECPLTNLKRIREVSGLSQSQLAAQAEVSLRSIQMYEQRNKDINKAHAITLAKISRALGCEVEDLLERETIGGTSK